VPYLRSNVNNFDVVAQPTEMNAPLYIIGNGFDLFNGLKTRYSDFHNFVIQNFPDLENRFEEYFHFETDINYLWKNFENDLSTFNYQSLFDEFNHIDVSSDSFRPSEVFGLEDEISRAVEELVDEIRNAFNQWVNEIEFPAKLSINYRFKESSLFVVFNYTGTLENLYKVQNDQILYIHNNSIDHHGELIFGHGQSEEQNPAPDYFDDNDEPTRTSFSDSEKASRFPFYAFMKNTEEVLSEHASFFNSLPHITQIIVLGHSLGQADWPYFKLLTRQFPHSKWKISFYSNEELDTLYAIATGELGIAPERIKMIKMEDEITRFQN
jgi:hypothetical protein